MNARTSFRRIACLLPDAVVVADANGRITWTNPAFHDLCGYPPDAVLNRKPGSFLQGPETDRQTVKRISSALRNREPITTEILNYHFNGKPYWVSLRIAPLMDNRGNLEGFIAIERDITIARCREHRLQTDVVQLYSAVLMAVGAKE